MTAAEYLQFTKDVDRFCEIACLLPLNEGLGLIEDAIEHSDEIPQSKRDNAMVRLLGLRSQVEVLRMVAAVREQAMSTCPIQKRNVIQMSAACLLGVLQEIK